MGNKECRMGNGKMKWEIKNEKLFLIFFLTIYNAEHVVFNSHY